MYYSKNTSPNISIPRNYSGNTFRVIDETERNYIKEDFDESPKSPPNISTKIDDTETKKEQKNSVLSTLFQDISLEDILLLGLMFVIHQDNPNDTTLLLLLILLLAK